LQRIIAVLIAVLALTLAGTASATVQPTPTVSPGTQSQVTSDTGYEVVSASDPVNVQKWAISADEGWGTTGSPAVNAFYTTTDDGQSAWTKDSSTPSGDNPAIAACPEQNGHAVYLQVHINGASNSILSLYRYVEGSGSGWTDIWDSATNQRIDKPVIAVDAYSSTANPVVYIAGRAFAQASTNVIKLMASSGTGSACTAAAGSVSFSSTPYSYTFGPTGVGGEVNSFLVYKGDGKHGQPHDVQLVYEYNPTSDTCSNSDTPCQEYRELSGNWDSGSFAWDSTNNNVLYRQDPYYKTADWPSGAYLDSQAVTDGTRMWLSFVAYDSATSPPHLVVLESDNRGATFTSPVSVDSPTVADGQSELMIGSHGVLGLAFLRVVRFHSSAGLDVHLQPCYDYNVYFTSSDDGGATWSTPTMLSNAESDWPSNCQTDASGDVLKRGTGLDYMIGSAPTGTVADDFHVVWPDWRTNPGSIYERDVSTSNLGDPSAKFVEVPTSRTLQVNVHDESSYCDGSNCSISWDWGDGAHTFGTGDTDHTYSGTGTYTITETVTGTLGGTSTAQKSVTCTLGIGGGFTCT
jgi:hypothetical protein